MLMNEIFAKDVQRPIEGVIKADDTAYLGTEVDEYVLTNEAAKGLELLLEAYTNYTNANGVWISGFFGSGKSHLLKMLAHLFGDVEGQAFDRAKATESFRAKATGAFLPALLTKAERIPAKSLLFNIDQKATLITKDQTDALLKVFVKVFDESRGYYGNQGHVARFERDLDNRDQYAAFKESYRRIAGRDWAQGREEGVLEEPNVAAAYAEVSGQGGAPTNILTKYRNEYSVSIEDFAEARSFLLPPTWTQLDSLAGRSVDEVLTLERQIVVVQPNLAVRDGNWEIEFFNSDRYNEARNRRAPQGYGD